MNVNEQISLHSGKSASPPKYNLDGRKVDETLTKNQSTNVTTYIDSIAGVLGMVFSHPGLRNVQTVKCLFFFLLIFNLNPVIAQTTNNEIQSFLQRMVESGDLKTSDIIDWKVTDEHISAVSEIHHLYYRQRHEGIEIYGANGSAHFSQNGNILKMNNAFVKDFGNKISGSSTPTLNAVDAVVAAASEMGYPLVGNFITLEEDARNLRYLISKGGVSLENIPAQLVYTKSGDNYKLAWNIAIYELEAQNWWEMRIDATNGQIISKNNWVTTCDWGSSESLVPNYKEDHSTHNHFIKVEEGSEETLNSMPMVGSYRVYAMPVESPDHGGRSLAINPDNPAASPFGWHDTNGAPGAESTLTIGNNVLASEDIDGDNLPGFSPDGTGALNFDFAIDLTLPPNLNLSPNITNLFYWNNVVHDVVYQYGFDEPSGNFQENNYGNGGLGSDRVNADAQNPGNCNANFATPGDGFNPRMQMFTCNNSTPDHDGDLDNLVIVHEYAHGISNRLVGGAGNTGCLNNSEQMGEGWSDFYGVWFTMEIGDLGTDSRGVGTYLFGQPPNGPGIRPFPYDTDLADNPQTYDDIKTAAVPHGVGSVWCTMLWEMTWEIINTVSFDPDFYYGTGGNNIAMALVTEGLKFTPCSPGFVDARDAILTADLALNGGAFQCEIWTAFAKRGLGQNASQGSPNSVTDGTEDFTIPVGVCAPPVAITCPNNAALSGCSVDDIDFGGTLGTYSDIPKSLTYDEFIALGGTITPGVPPYNITYQDVMNGSCPITVTRTFNITDNANTSDQCTQTITVDDNTFPTIDCPLDIHIYLGGGECDAQVDWVIDADDNCGDPVLVQTFGPPSGSIFDKDFSPYTITYKATDGCNNMTTCSFKIFIHDNVPDDNSLSCGDQINVSMDEDCQFEFTADYMLTGNDYHCYEDYDTYVMECHTCDPIPTSPIITPEYIGDTLIGKVCDPITNICCWGYIVVEDKGIPSLCWADFSMSCTGSTHPDSITGITKEYPYLGPSILIPDAIYQDPGMVTLTIDVECDTLAIIDIIANLDITHTDLSDLSAQITGPDGFTTALPLPTPSNLAAFVGRNASGTWTIKIFDNVMNGSSGTVNAASLEIEANYAKPVPIDNCDSDMTPTWTDVVTDPDCNDENCYQKIIRTWCVTDDSGNEFCCDQVICLTRPNLEDLVCPPDYDGLPGNEDMLSCIGNFPKDSNGHPDPSHTGYPTLEGFDVDGFCMFYCVYSDDSIDICEGSHIIVREWECYDWCEGTDTTCTQVIKVMDNDPPDIECPAPISLNAGYGCISGTTLPPPVLTDECSPSGVHYDAFIESGEGDLVYSNGNWILSDIPVGTTTVCYPAWDGCGNRDTCCFDVNVYDGTPPIVNCETYHTVGISGSPSWYNAIDFDDGSEDNCSDITYEVKRLANPNCEDPDGLETAFGPKVPFYCCDIGDTIEVILKITDEAGLMNFCTSYVTVQDNVAPTHINCPGEVEVPCTTDIDNPANTGGEPTFFDNCDSIAIVVTTSNPQYNCGRDTLYRKWVATDEYGNKDSCIQRIIVVNDDPFDGNEDIDWPDHLIDPGVSCDASTHPDDLPSGGQRPEITFNDICDNVSISDPEDLYLYPIDPENSDFCYKIKRTWEVIDWCFVDDLGQPAIYEFEQIIKIVDNDPPTFTCSPDVAVSLGDPVVAEVNVIGDNCSNLAEISVTYDIDQNYNGISFDPEIEDQQGPDAGGPSGPATNYPEGVNLVRFIVTDGCYTSDTCFVEVVVTSGPSSTFTVSGAIANEEGNEVEYVNVEVEGDNMNDLAITGNDGTYSFNLESNSNYAITPERDDNILNGVSTYDLVLISKHILQLEMLPSPYKIIAADVNHSGAVSTIDMVALRRVILFIEDEFPDNTSWRFVDAEFVFPDPTNPFATSFPEVFTINGLTDDEVGDFVGVKIGDVNGSAAPNDLTGSSDDRNADGELIFALQDQSLKVGETYQINFEAKDFDQVAGFQFTMSFDENVLAFNEVGAGGLINISDANFGLHKLNEGLITASWNANGDAQTIENGETLFSLTFTTMKDAQLSDLININSRLTKAEAYDNLGLLDLSLEFIGENGIIAAEQFELYQNQPNPFKNETVIGFNMPESGKATFKVFDISGRVIKLIEDDFSKGYNEISLNRSDLRSNGVLYYQLETAKHIASKKMVLIE